jgi:hypothetical protein
MYKKKLITTFDYTTLQKVDPNQFIFYTLVCILYDRHRVNSTFTFLNKVILIRNDKIEIDIFGTEYVIMSKSVYEIWVQPITFKTVSFLKK